MRAVVRICFALLALCFVVFVGVSVVLQRVCSGDDHRAHLPGAASSAIDREAHPVPRPSRTGGPYQGTPTKKGR